MATQPIKQPLIVIVGPTASGKTALAIRIAKQVGGEIISADSRTVYTDMDIGTAKPSLEEREGIAHHGFDLIPPEQRFTAADFQQYVFQKIGEIRARGNVPIMVGGTGLYVDAVIFNYQFGQDRDESMRAELNEMTVEELQKYCAVHSITLPTNVKNKRHLIRAIELNGINHKREPSILDATYIVGIATERDVLQKRIEVRAHTMFTQGVVEETKKLAADYGWESEAMTASVYRIIRRLLEGEITQQQATELIVRSDMHLAKRQMTWFRRNSFIQWSSDPSELEKQCLALVNQFRS